MRDIVFQGDDRYDFDNANPFAGDDEEQEVASVGYRSVRLHKAF